MRYALVDNEKKEASPGLLGYCEGCSQPMIPKCGTQRLWHWAHQGKRHCDTWWEPETEWHRDWKEKFPKEWQEFHQTDKNGERHIADVRTDYGLVIEFQHSHLKPQERAAREAFYRNMVWIVDGTRLTRDAPRLQKALQTFRPIWQQGVFITPFPNECFNLAWIESAVPVFFDFGIRKENGDGSLWCLMPGRIEGHAVVVTMSQATLLKAVEEKILVAGCINIWRAVDDTLRKGARAAESRALRANFPPRWRRSFRPRRF